MQQLLSNPPKSFELTEASFTGHLRAPETVMPPGDVADARMAVYRDLVYSNIERMMSNLFPVLRTVTADEPWHALVRDFFQRHQCHAGIFTKIPLEFVQFLESERDLTQDPPFILDLAHYEWVEYAATIDPREIDWQGIDPMGPLLDAVPTLNPIAWLLTYRYPVQKLGPSYLPDAPPTTPTYLVVCRDRDDKVSFLDLNPVSARLLELIQQDLHLSGRALLERIALELAHPDPDAVVSGGLEILERLRARDVILGTRA